MSYSVLEDIQIRISENILIQLTDDTDSGAVDSSKVEAAVEWADEIIDGYIRGRYTLPLTEIPGLIRNISVDLAIYRLYTRRMTADIPESITNIFKSSLKILSDIQTNKVSIGINEVQTPKSKPTYTFRTTLNQQIFSKDLLDSY